MYDDFKQTIVGRFQWNFPVGFVLGQRREHQLSSEVIWISVTEWSELSLYVLVAICARLCAALYECPSIAQAY